MKSQKLSLLNTRAFKKSNNHFIISIGSNEKKKKQNIKFNDNIFDIEYGEFSGYL